MKPCNKFITFVDQRFPSFPFSSVPLALSEINTFSYCYDYYKSLLLFFRHSWQVTTFLDLALQESWLFLKIKTILKGLIISPVKRFRAIRYRVWWSLSSEAYSEVIKISAWLPACLLWEQLDSFAKKSSSVVISVRSCCTAGKLDRNMFSVFCIPSLSPPRSNQFESLIGGSMANAEKSLVSLKAEISLTNYVTWASQLIFLEPWFHL